MWRGGEGLNELGLGMKAPGGGTPGPNCQFKEMSNSLDRLSKKVILDNYLVLDLLFDFGFDLSGSGGCSCGPVNVVDCLVHLR